MNRRHAAHAAHPIPILGLTVLCRDLLHISEQSKGSCHCVIAGGVGRAHLG